MTLTSWWRLLLHLLVVPLCSSPRCICCLASANLPRHLCPRRTGVMSHHSSHSVHFNPPNATIVRRCQHSNTAFGTQETNHSQALSNWLLAQPIILPKVNCWAPPDPWHFMSLLINVFLTYPAKGDYLKPIHALHYKFRSDLGHRSHTPWALLGLLPDLGSPESPLTHLEVIELLPLNSFGEVSAFYW